MEYKRCDRYNTIQIELLYVGKLIRVYKEL